MNYYIMKEYMVAAIKRDNKLWFLPLRRKFLFGFIPGKWWSLTLDWKDNYDAAYEVITKDGGKL